MVRRTVPGGCDFFVWTPRKVILQTPSEKFDLGARVDKTFSSKVMFLTPKMAG
jgi:hypothetical protein